ncbi:MAG: hypothetical protein CVU57_26250 [Deltaproteobacteria bacterium HGW-Deltaproteobacteria-15]|jgi:N-acetylglutamate synthase-like GNAT family acetyltransferase|nr:MAG: hypothetical protein CVU57_26250 [Deltaproteobacteria bacterium HGW-Deltaproteobacteria-15]
MKTSLDEKGFTLREATESDIAKLSIHHRKMFEEIWGKKGQCIDNSTGNELEQEYSRKLRAELPGGSCKSWLIEKDGQVAASGAITIVSFVPTPTDLSSRVAYLHSVYTEPGMRGNRFSGVIVKAALAYCRTNGIKRVILNASEAGRPIYERIGFCSYPEMMRFFVE